MAKKPMSAAAQRGIYAAVNIPFMIMQAPAFMILPALYVKHAGLELVLVGTILTVLRVLDAVLDPVIGFLSDRTRSRLGRRKPWILVGAVLGGVGTLAAFQPQYSTGYVYFTIAFFLMTLGWTLQEIAHSAWLSELSEDPQERHSLSTWRYNAGMLATALVPLIPLTGLFKTTEMTPQVMSVAAWLVVIFLFLTIPPMFLLPNGNTHTETVRKVPAKIVFRDMFRNRPFLLFVAIFTTQGLASGMVSGLYYFYLDNYLHVSDRYSYVMLAVYALFVVGAGAWLWLARWIDKHIIIGICTLLVAATNIVMYLIVPGPQAFWQLLGAFSVSAIATAGAMAAQNAMLSDIVDFGTLESGENHSGNYFAALTFINKFNLAAGSGIAFVIAGLFGFSAKGTNGPLAMTGFFVAIIWIPFALNVVSGLLCWRYPLNRKRLEDIRAQLQLKTAPSEDQNLIPEKTS
ncbi:MAG: MFS transporter [Asticcacaulis sp.]|uniref:MFS transporter n=1 Tax=Asticcacaulis sp. TaxID=1872648 RepID=UPI0039E3B15A